ncbi:MAG: type-F conjugative transfer system pilin assembly protein TrbC, partial [Pseudomonadota bacterium]
MTAWLILSSSHAQDTAPQAAEESAPGEEVTKLSGGPPDIPNDIMARAKAAAQRGRERQRGGEAEAYSRALQGALGLTEDGTNEDGATPPDQHLTNLTTVAFVSSSVPLPTLRAYAEQLEKVGGHFVFRGVPGGMSKITPFVEYSLDVLRLDPFCKGPDCEVRNVGILIDPLLFRSSGVTRVPAFAVFEADIFQSYCQRQGEPLAVAAVSLGDVHLTGHLAELTRLGDPNADRLLK